MPGCSANLRGRSGGSRTHAARFPRSFLVARLVGGVFIVFLSTFSLSKTASIHLMAQEVSPPAESEELFTRAVQDYTQNRFLMARTEFDKVHGTRAQDAQQYTTKINAYLEDMQIGADIMGRSEDELDAPSLEYAIQRYQDAVRIKPEGPGEPGKLLEKAKGLYASRAQQRSVGMQGRDADFCAKALAAAKQHRYKDAVLYSCPLANDNPAYSCGGYEAVQLCQQMSDLAKSEDSSSDESSDESSKERTIPAQTDGSNLIGKAKAAYEKNDFEKARSLLAKAPGEQKSAADDYIDKISRYQGYMAQAKQSSDASAYEEARTAFTSAASIKPDGPGDPGAQALIMQLEEGVDQFYSGDYVSATHSLETYAQGSKEKEKESLARFYLGASKLARFFITGGEDSSLQQDALHDLKIAKQAGYKAKGDDLSPRILETYNSL